MKVKRFLGVLLALVMIIGIVPITASANGTNALYGSTSENINTAGNLRDILTQEVDTLYIKLTSNIALEEDLAIDTKTVHIDLAGFTVTAAADGVQVIIRNRGNLTMTDTSSGNSGTVCSAYQGTLFNVYPNSSLTFSDGNYKAEKGNIVTTGSSSTVTINGGTFETTGTSAVAFSMNGNNSNLNINGGSFKAFLADRPNIQYRYGTINVTNFDTEVGALYVRYANSSDEAVQISSFVTLGNTGFMTADADGVEIEEIETGDVFRIARAYEVKFDFNGGSSESLKNYKFPVPGNIPVPAWNMVTAPAGKELLYWECNGKRYQGGSSLYVTDAGTVTLKAIWQDQVQYIVKLHANNGTANTIISQVWSIYTLPAELPENWTVNEGFYFAGWAETTNGEPLTGQVQLKGDTDFYAIFKRTPYEVSYTAEGATSVPRTQTKQHGVRLMISNQIPRKEGHDFIGWSDTETGTVYSPGDSYEEDKPLALEAIWKVHTYELSFVAEGATNVPAKQTKTYGVVLKISEQKPQKDGYFFYGWAETADGAVTYKAGDDYTENNEKTLYAVWMPTEFTVFSYDANSKTAEVVLPEAGTYTVVFADYNGKSLVNIEYVPITVSTADVAEASITKDFTLGTGDKIMIWSATASLMPKCETYIMK